LVKRYVSEPGSSTVDLIFDKSLAGELTTATSIWNIGEVLGEASALGALDPHPEQMGKPRMIVAPEKL